MLHKFLVINVEAEIWSCHCCNLFTRALTWPVAAEFARQSYLLSISRKYNNHPRPLSPALLLSTQADSQSSLRSTAGDELWTKLWMKRRVENWNKKQLGNMDLHKAYYFKTVANQCRWGPQSSLMIFRLQLCAYSDNGRPRLVMAASWLMVQVQV